ncbi:GNAT family N-acetyltransferase [uncultured Akkermansia sp.]|uniref:GNAT family N-acetyltransferase n=1 Tax=uncultured Akkermansia sp. TaxID=512294 RepID=UPI00261322D5|nr:GNAT family N-acetyltransferase [uncultured Akkermansia sp.]
MARTFPIERETAVWPPPAPLRELLRDADPDERRIADHLAHGELYVARNCGAAAGVIVIRQTGENTWEIMNCSVAPEYRRQRCGTALVRHALDIIRNKGGRYAEVGTSDASPGPMSLYESCGFQVSGVINNHFTDNYPEPVWDNGVQCIDMIRMRADLSLREEGGPHAAQKA